MVKILSNVLISLTFVYFCGAHPHKTNVKDLEKEHMLTTNEYYVEKVNQMAGISCDLCMRAVYGVNYDFIQLKKDVIEMIRLDCEALFHDRAEDISECIRFLTTKVEKYSGKKAESSFLDVRVRFTSGTSNDSDDRNRESNMSTMSQVILKYEIIAATSADVSYR
ncbi:CRE-SPP-22 protein [Caenorhabditis remanei]|uniref:CRE-SPP-22 protein n=1 Tax=Caenorhabditis remanei TaxID=31234 RepID=E3LD31_CAERE|nr:CRE-SPP-22 protein [Caenorhabditis remanei]